ncbi:MAG TPA: S1/P1 nuclease [Chthoniobacterales bacterium]|jgi:hypothetical protein
MMKALLLATLLCLTFVSRTFAYGFAGHEVIGKLAEQQLDGTRAGREVRALLHADETLARASTWADRAKFEEKYLSAEMKDFVANNPKHNTYHYCDIPFQQKAYRAGLTGTHDRDIVHTLEACIRVLQQPVDNADNPLKIKKRVALMLIAHYVGDLHQPLHVGCSYVDDKDRFVDPETGAKGEPDAGANNFRLTTRTTLHGYWDTQTVKLARDKAGREDFTAYLSKQFPAKREWKAAGAVTTWPQQWATDTLGLSKLCFEGITLGKRFKVPWDGKQPEHFEWKVTLAPDYDAKARDIVEVQLAKAGYRLAELLKAVWPEK